MRTSIQIVPPPSGESHRELADCVCAEAEIFHFEESMSHLAFVGILKCSPADLNFVILDSQALLESWTTPFSTLEIEKGKKARMTRYTHRIIVTNEN
jgi:hypothetical protein